MLANCMACDATCEARKESGAYSNIILENGWYLVDITVFGERRNIRYYCPEHGETIKLPTPFCLNNKFT